MKTIAPMIACVVCLLLMIGQEGRIESLERQIHAQNDLFKSYDKEVSAIGDCQKAQGDLEKAIIERINHGN